MDIVVKGRKTEVPERFRKHSVEKLEKIRKLDGKVISIDLEVSKERNPRLADRSDRVEITLRSKGPVVRAEAAATDPYAALDLAMSKLEAQLRKTADRRRVHRGHHAPMSTGAATAELNGSARFGGAQVATVEEIEALDGVAVKRMEGPIQVDGEGPLVVREKVHAAPPMALDQALYEMELVGHDFYLFVDATSMLPSVVYRRRGYDYGVIQLRPAEAETEMDEA
ncbi:ribosome hibernation-promoting factor, HPF/YfiA family [Yinghuangia seranimata]|uniref:ribosome hibernation-promoting factor, HPF/YfiA family n=1 Tax=Yinghuangia seranimata TaxID=408067 RepID=UPI00248C7307|nr:ribosome-associated translation inhibitor RaiA [Yinghuangia seranimata]MDI2131438.1 ribosome-associated translation inhibitor RaiA [Yinghuangia seranimata]